MIKRVFTFLVIAAMLAITFPIASNATTTLYVGPGQTYTTIMAAYDAAAAGDTIIVKDGTYYETAALSAYGVLKLYKYNITIRAENKWGATIDAQNNTSYPYCVYTVNEYGYTGDNNIVDGFILKNGAYGGVKVDSNNCQILNCQIFNNGTAEGGPNFGEDGIFTFERTSGTIISGNYIYNNGRPVSSANDRLDHGIYNCGDNEVIINNVIAGNSSRGIHVAGYDNASDIKIYNNTIVNNGVAGIEIWDGGGKGKVTNLEVKNNIIDNNDQRWEFASDGFGISFYGKARSITGTVISNNLFNENQGGTIDTGYTYTGSNNISGIPGFVNGSTPYCITATSPAFDAGASVTGVPTDFDGNNRPQGAASDIGAYEVIAP